MRSRFNLKYCNKQMNQSRKDFMTLPTTWMKFKDTQRNEQTQKDTLQDATHRRSLESSEPETGSRMVGAGEGRGWC
jgi:hypothetical protein